MHESPDGGQPAVLRRELASEREQLVDALGSLRRSTDVTRELRRRLPLAAGAAFAVGFVVSGGIGAVARLLFRRGREHERILARVGPFVIVAR